jgi:putative ABC transport system substrate-binding protein
MSCVRLLVLLCLLVAWPAAAQQQEGMRRVGILIPKLGIHPNAGVLDPFRHGMRELGWSEGRDYAVILREHGTDAADFAAAMNELAAERVEAIVLITLQAALVVRARLPAMPIIVLSAADPVGNRVAESLARPGGTITGLTLMSPELLSKRVALLKEIVPRFSRLAIVQNPRTPASPLMAQAATQAAQQLDVTSRLFDASAPEEIRIAFDAAKAWSADALILLDDALFFLARGQAVALARERRLPLACPFTLMTREGCLLSYATNLIAQFERAGSFIDKIFKGEKAGNLPFQQPTRFDLVINLKTAAALGLDVPPTLLAVADEVIE